MDFFTMDTPCGNAKWRTSEGNAALRLTFLFATPRNADMSLNKNANQVFDRHVNAGRAPVSPPHLGEIQRRCWQARSFPV
jgi:hypothetical protein